MRLQTEHGGSYALQKLHVIVAMARLADATKQSGYLQEAGR